GDLQRQENAKDGEVDATAPEEHVEVEDREREQEPGEPVREVVLTGERSAELRRLGEDDEDPEREPEASVRRECGRAERVLVAELPLPSEQLNEPAVEECEPHPHQIGDEVRVVAAQHERRQREGG